MSNYKVTFTRINFTRSVATINATDNVNAVEVAKTYYDDNWTSMTWVDFNGNAVPTGTDQLDVQFNIETLGG